MAWIAPSRRAGTPWRPPPPERISCRCSSQKERCPDLVLLDVMMPGLNGLEVLRTLQARPNWKGLPVVLITAATDESLRTTARQAGAADLLVKPFRLRERLERIEAHVFPTPEEGLA